MNVGTTATTGEIAERWLWPEYYREFPGFSPETVRPGCHPRKMVHPSGGRQAIVLVHGLTDSAYYMQAIGEFFHERMGFDVFIPLLQCHGLKSPDGMVGVALAEWQRNIDFALTAAAKGGVRVCIGGLSTGGALGYFFGRTDGRVSGDVYLFSAALGLPDGPCGIPGRFKEWLLRRPFVGGLGSSWPMVGRNPYRYDRVGLNSAGELARLIEKIDRLPEQSAFGNMPGRRIFAAWSECDRVISLDKLRRLRDKTPEGFFTSFAIARKDQVEHACVVLRHSIRPPGAGPEVPPLERANPRFAEMLEAMARFAAAGPQCI